MIPPLYLLSAMIVLSGVLYAEKHGVTNREAYKISKKPVISESVLDAAMAMGGESAMIIRLF